MKISIYTTVAVLDVVLNHRKNPPFREQLTNSIAGDVLNIERSERPHMVDGMSDGMLWWNQRYGKLMRPQLPDPLYGYYYIFHLAEATPGLAYALQVFCEIPSKDLVEITLDI